MFRWSASIIFFMGASNTGVLSLLENRCYNTARSSGLLSSPTMSTVSLHCSASNIDRYESDLDILRQACQTRAVLSDVIASSINQIEKSAKNIKCNDLKGDWELIYSSIIPGGYFPVTEIADFFAYSLTSSFGYLPLGGFQGKSTVISETNPAVIEFSSDKYRLGGLEFKIKNPKSRSYTFLYVDQYFAVARSSSGGGTLLKKV